MDQKDLKEILDCLSKDRTLYPYCRDRYAVNLLRIAARRHRSIPALKRSHFGRLMEKPSVASLLAHCGDGHIDTRVLDIYWQSPGTTYLLTAGIWGDSSGRYQQTTRRGFNLVLRLNFNAEHDRLFAEKIRPIRDAAFNGLGHPVLRTDERDYFRETLAWARLDIDLSTDEVLIEEIQSDWVRYVSRLEARTSRCRSDDGVIRNHRFQTTAGRAREYLHFVRPMLRDWSAAMLAASIDFVDRELGVSKIWYHSWETGTCLKGIDHDCAPPRSLYSRLPRQFCFSETEDMPRFLARKHIQKRLNRAKVSPRFYTLEL